MEKETKSTVDIQNLHQAFEIFNEATKNLTDKYDTLKNEVERLRNELRIKNDEIQDSANLLNAILMNSTSGILTIDSQGNILIKNEFASFVINEYGDGFIKVLLDFSENGVYEFTFSDRQFRLSCGNFPFKELTVFIYIFDDITNLKNLEAEKERNEKLAIMGEMAANIAHDIRNPLGGIELYASMLQRDLQGDRDKTNLAVSILKGVKTINTTISNILLFTRDVHVSKKVSYISDIIDDLILYMKHLMNEKKIKFINKIDADGEIFCDSELMKQVFMNLIHNSIDAVNEFGEITISSGNDGYNTFVEIIDNGSGIKKDFLKKLFIPFQTTKAKGTGLGLSIVYRIVKAHGGNIFAESDGENWTKFTVSIPFKR